MTPAEWNSELNRLTAFFQQATIPTEKILIEGFLTVYHPKTFVATCIFNLENANYSPWMEGNFDRLQKMERYILDKGNG